MTKLLTLENLSAFRADAVYKICLSLEKYGMTDENIISCPDYDELLLAAETNLSAGDEVIIAAEPHEFNSVKMELISFLSVESFSSPQIAEAIAMHSDGGETDFDMQSFCTVPENCVCHISPDGLYSGFSIPAFNGRLTFVPLDFGRLDTILQSYIVNCLEPQTAFSQPQEDTSDGEMQESPYDFSQPVSKMIYSLMQVDKRLAIATGEATMWIYNLYDKIDGLSDVVNFVDIIDESEESEPQADDSQPASEEYSQEPTESNEPAETDEPTETDGEARQEDPFDETASEQDETQVLPQIQQPDDEPAEKESVSAKTIRHAREAMRNTGSDFGAAISDVYTSESEDGTTNYFALVAVADENGAKAKKINTTSFEDSQLLLPHCVTVLSETVCQKVDAVSLSLETETEKTPDEKKGEKKLSKGMIAFAAVIALIAVISPIVILSSFLGGSNDPTLPAVLQTTDNISTTSAPITEYTTVASSDLFGTMASSAPINETDAIFAPAEPTAADVSVITTSPPVSSTKGTFTFYVFGYGHGVGLSQTGANSLASQGWSFAQILANYYYGATLVSGDTYPESINYNGTDYSTRDFLAGALNGEMGDSFNTEALKAQAIAIYTFAKYYSFKLDTSGTAFKAGASEKIYGVVDDVIKNGFYIAYNGQTALTPFHAISAGYTTSYRNTWGNTEVLYLAGGRPSYGDYSAQDFKTTVSMSSDEFKSLAESAGLGISCSGDPATWISIISHDTAVNESIGYVSSINVGGKIMTGNDFRLKVMGGKIRSHCFTVVYTPSAS